MRLADVYQLVIELGKEYDPRPVAEIDNAIGRVKKQYEDMKQAEKEFFDQERLANPYGDTRILCGDPQNDVQTVLAGIDMETPEILLADRLRERGEKIDLILAHHPEGKALTALHQVMHLQEDILAHLGIPINVAEGLLASRISEVERGLMPLNHNRAVDAARLLGFSFMCAHTPADNMVTKYLDRYLAERKPETVGDVLQAVKEIPEYREAMNIGAGPRVVVGSEKKRAGKIFVDMTGGTSGSEDVYPKLAAAGVGTILAMHMGEKHRKEAEKNFINVVIPGHISSDSLGMNLLLDVLEEKGLVVRTCAGLTRVKRK